MNEFLQGNSCANHVITQVLRAPERAGSSVIGTNSDTFSSAQNQHRTVGQTSASLASLKCLVWTDVECRRSRYLGQTTPRPRFHGCAVYETVRELWSCKWQKVLMLLGFLKKHSFYSLQSLSSMPLNDSNDYDLLKIKMHFIPHYCL